MPYYSCAWAGTATSTSNHHAPRFSISTANTKGFSTFAPAATKTMSIPTMTDSKISICLKIGGS